MMRKSKVQTLADRISAKIRIDPDYQIPSIGELRLELHASYVTVWKAVKLLAQQGLVRCVSGKKPVVIRPDAKHQEQPNSTRALYEALLDGIVTGKYRSGEALPKARFYTLSFNVSPNTVTAAMRLLKKDGLVRKAGKRWIVGTPSKRRPSAILQPHPEGAPAALLIASWPWAHQRFFVDQLLEQFSMVLREELQRFEIELIPTYAQRPETFLPFIRAAGRNEIRALVRNLGSRYRGAIVLVGGWQQNELAKMADQLTATGAPVVFFDQEGSGVRLAESLSPSVRNKFYRVHISQKNAIQLALQTLVGRGHSVIGVPYYKVKAGYNWVRPRIDIIEAEAAKMNPAPEIIVEEQVDEAWHPQPITTIPEFEDMMNSRFDTPESELALPQPKWESPSLEKLLSRRGCTALLALNDGLAKDYYTWLRAKGVKIPQRLSMLSFDNTADAALYALSTIDFGLSQQAYLAAHVLIGDVPVRADKKRNLAAECMLVDRGTIRRIEPRRGRAH